MIKENIIYYYEIKRINKLARRVLRQVSKDLSIKDKLILNIVLSDNDFIHEYNLKYRNIDRETDVLSFPSEDDGCLGDIIISIDRAKAQAEEYGHSLDREIGFLIIHGCLHCLGYDHIEKADEEIMFPLQEKILNEINLRRE